MLDKNATSEYMIIVYYAVAAPKEALARMANEKCRNCLL